MEYCPRSACAWISQDGKCHWPTDHCPWQAQKEAAAKRLQEIRNIQIAVRQSKHCRSRIAGTPETGGWVVYIAHQKGKGQHKRRIGVFDTKQEAIAVRREADRQCRAGTLEQWLKSRQKG